jgi:hypothetical protein
VVDSSFTHNSQIEAENLCRVPNSNSPHIQCDAGEHRVLLKEDLFPFIHTSHGKTPPCSMKRTFTSGSHISKRDICSTSSLSNLR